MSLRPILIGVRATENKIFSEKSVPVHLRFAQRSILPNAPDRKQIPSRNRMSGKPCLFWLLQALMKRKWILVAA
jgi:hypothetical protein